MKKLLALILAALLVAGLVPALGAAKDFFPDVKEYSGFADVPADSWYESNVVNVCRIGIMQGTDKGFEPFKDLSVAECAAVAARIRATLTGEAIPSWDGTGHWAKPYLDHLAAADPSLSALLDRPGDPCTRLQYLQMLGAALALHPDILTPINAITALPDAESPLVLTFYNAGILTGADDYGTFAGDKTLTRAECAAMVSRIARPALRKTFTPAAVPTPVTASLEDSLAAGYFQGDKAQAVLFAGTQVTPAQFLPQVNVRITFWEDFCRQTGQEFNWHLDTGDGRSILAHVKEEALTALGVAETQGTPAYRSFDYQVYYSRLIDRIGAPLGQLLP